MKRETRLETKTNIVKDALFFCTTIRTRIMWQLSVTKLGSSRVTSLRLPFSLPISVFLILSRTPLKVDHDDDRVDDKEKEMAHQWLCNQLPIVLPFLLFFFRGGGGEGREERFQVSSYAPAAPLKSMCFHGCVCSPACPEPQLERFVTKWHRDVVDPQWPRLRNPVLLQAKAACGRLTEAVTNRVMLGVSTSSTIYAAITCVIDVCNKSAFSQCVGISLFYYSVVKC